MLGQIARFTNKLIADHSAHPREIAFAAQDDIIVADGNPELARLAGELLSRLSCLGMAVARPALPFADFLVARTPRDESHIVPRDTETRTFLHDIPFLRRGALGDDPAAKIARLLGNRKGIIVEGTGIVASGALTVEQAYINWSSIFHSAFVKYLQDVLHGGFLLPGEAEAFDAFRRGWLRPLTAEGLVFREGPLTDPGEILDEIAAVGRYTVERGLVDSFFGNISCKSGGVIYISQTAASLDALDGCIDPVPTDNSSTFGITASSELLAHRRIYEQSGASTILHGHPKFAVVMSMECAERNCTVTDCWKDCDRVRFLGDTPVVAGEIGAGGLAKRVPPVIAGPRKAVVYGHGVFTVGERGFGDAFRSMVEVENWCRDAYFRALEGKLAKG
ncbi:class II aldolase/adducin family protein [Geobacter sp.]|uniref:class II aldolase/adducin family protein n=1 Tax=Geobacter sp. TaxID=46610 RepID=UPI002634CE68|nr:class II aldolase/adducin family protein [Geobacter sp.]